MPPILLDAAGRRRQPVTLPGYHVGRPPRNKGRRYPADPPTVEEIIAVGTMVSTGPTAMVGIPVNVATVDGCRLARPGRIGGLAPVEAA